MLSMLHHLFSSKNKGLKNRPGWIFALITQTFFQRIFNLVRRKSRHFRWCQEKYVWCFLDKIQNITYIRQSNTYLILSMYCIFKWNGIFYQIFSKSPTKAKWSKEEKRFCHFHLLEYILLLLYFPNLIHHACFGREVYCIKALSTMNAPAFQIRTYRQEKIVA